MMFESQKVKNLRALLEADEENEKLLEENIELKRKYTNEVEKNYRFVGMARGEVACEER